MGIIRRPRGAGALAALLAVAGMAAGCSKSPASHASSSRPASPAASAPPSPASAAAPSSYLLTAPAAVGSDKLNRAAIASGAYAGSHLPLSQLNKILSQHRGGHASSPVFGIYDLRPPVSETKVPPLMILAGANGHFDPQNVASTLTGATHGALKPVPPGPHGGMAACGHSGSGSSAEDACAWATSTTFALLTVTGTDTRDVGNLTQLMLSVRQAAERPS